MKPSRAFQTPRPRHHWVLINAVLTLLAIATPPRSAALEAITDKIVVLTFDDSVKSHFTVVRPLLKQHGFGATFFITEGFDFKTNKEHYMTWEEIAQLHQDGFEIGNHTRDHLGLNPGKPDQLRKQLERLPEQLAAINDRCAEHGIPRPVTYAYPGNGTHPDAWPILHAAGIRFARRGGAPEFPYEHGRGFAYEPGADHPLLIPTAGDARPDWTLEDFKRAADQARFGRIAVIQFHGAPDLGHPWVHTPPERFREYMDYLAKNQFRVIAMRDLEKFVDPSETPEDAQAVIRTRQKAVADDRFDPWFKSLATEGTGPKGFASTEAAKRAVLTLQVPVINPWAPVPGTVKVERDVEYGRAAGAALKLDLYSPRHRNGPTPGLVFIHGGAWKGGKRTDYHYYGVRFAELGYVVATISYRLLPEHPYPAAVHDAKCAIRWLRANASAQGVDPDRIAVLGGSAGGHLAMMVGYSPDVMELEGQGGHAGVSSRVQAVVNLYGPTDLTTSFGRHSRLVHAFLDGSFEDYPSRYRQASPLSHLDASDPPTFIIHGTVDDTVPIAQADLLARRLKERGIPFRYDRLEGWPHALDLSKSVNDRIVEKVGAFLKEHLGPSD